MDHRQQTAMKYAKSEGKVDNACHKVYGDWSTLLTVDIDSVSGTTWHVSVSKLDKHGRPLRVSYWTDRDKKFAQDLSKRMLNGVGMSNETLTYEFSLSAFHLRVLLTEEEQLEMATMKINAGV